jgi:CHAD domain-containing protein
MTHARTKTAGPYIARKLRECDEAVRAATPRVTSAADDEAIHDLRVAIRRLRTLLKMSRRLYGRWHADVVRRAYADVQRATGDLRDEEVLEETLGDVSGDPSFATWLRSRRTRERRLRRAVVTRLEHGDLDRASLLLKALLVFPVPPKRDVALAHFARRVVDRARRGVEEKRDVAVHDATGLHNLRIAYKELRYSIELLADALPIDQRAMLEPATVFQKRLGELHDVDVAMGVVRHATKLPGEARAGALTALETLREKHVVKYLHELDPLAAQEPEKAVEGAAVDAGDAPSEHGGSTNGAGGA